MSNTFERGLFREPDKGGTAGGEAESYGPDDPRSTSGLQALYELSLLLGQRVGSGDKKAEQTTTEGKQSH